MVITLENAADISSPKFPENYPNDANCTWHIVANNNTRIELSIEGHEIERQVLKLAHSTISLCCNMFYWC